MVVTDYLRTYGEQIFFIISRERRSALESHYEVIIPKAERYHFLTDKQMENFKNYFMEQY
jgi:hypothetical protein